MASNSLSKGQQNFTTLAIACVDEIRIVFRDILESKIKIDDLYTKIQSCQDLSTGDYKLETIQREICEKATDYEKFDVTLLYKLIRNLCLNHEPSKRKGKTLSKSNLRNIKDAIEYLKEFRNEAYAHLTSSEVSDEEFTQHWDNLEKHIHKIQTFMESLGKKVHYKEDIASIKRIRYYQNDLNKYKNLLELIVILWKQLENKDAPFITVEGNGEILCGEKACFEAVTKNCPVNNNWQITWQRIRGKITEIIDISEKKYDGSSSKRLVIPRVSMEDDGEYQAVIATVHKGTLSYVTSNSFRLDVIGDPPNLDIKEAITGIDITILYNIENTSPVIEKIEWTKDKKRLEMDPTKYKGGGITDNYLEILSPSENDAGEYKCTVSNAVGSVVKQIVLAVASVEICKELKVPLGGCATIESSIQSCPSLKEVVWQRSKDGKPENFMTIDINDVTYFGSNSDKNKPTLEIRNASYGDNLYYRLKVANGIGITTSNAVIVELVGDYPSVFTYHETKTRDMSVKLLCKVSLSEGSPEVTNVVWTKDKKDIEISSSGGKFGEENTEEFSLLIHKVNANDAGEYQCRVSNSVGCMYGNPIYLGKLSLSYCDTEDNKIMFTYMSININ
ncbi:titin-like [Saccostrea cucullata]|uniref:titin-like n=1 Tax=Saccostrea cuccullata TaxID=36930 RepID=UPI002ED3EB1E